MNTQPRGGFKRVWQSSFEISVVALCVVFGIVIVAVIDRNLIPPLLIVIAIISTVAIGGSYLFFKTVGGSVTDALINMIAKYRAVSVGQFNLEHRGAARYYVDLSKIFDAGESQAMAQLMAEAIRESGVNFDHVVGILMENSDKSKGLSREGYHLAPIIASILGKPYGHLYENNSKLLFDGDRALWRKVVLVDDVITTGGSINNAISYLESLDKPVKVVGCYAYISRLHSSKFGTFKASIEQRGINLRVLLDSKVLIDALYERGEINKRERDEAYLDEDLQGLATPT